MMSNKVLCTCGKDHACDQPLVITIKTCPKNKHKPAVFPKPPGDENLSSSSAVAVKDKSVSHDLESDHILICEDGGAAIPLVNAEKPLIDNSISCDLDKTKDKASGSRIGGIKKSSIDSKSRKGDRIGLSEEIKVIDPKSDNKKTGKDSPAFDDRRGLDGKKSRASIDKATDSSSLYPKPNKESKASMKAADDPRGLSRFETRDKGTETPSKVPKIGKATDKMKPETNQLFFDPSYEFDQEEEDFMKSTLTRNGAGTKKEYIEIKKTKSSSSAPLGTDRRQVPPDPRAREVGNNYPPQNQLKLPILTPRYHGPGCAMEVNVLERHDPSCRYRKEKNPNRSPLDDRSGSYDVIGRLMYKTCNPEFSTYNAQFSTTPQRTCCKSCSKNTRVTNLYSLLNVPRCNGLKEPIVENNCNRQELQRYLRKKRILEDLAKNTKSFPNQTRYVEEHRKLIQMEQGGCNSVGCKQNMASYELEVLYFYETKCDKSIQFTKPSSSMAIKKWFYYIMPCITMEKSDTIIVNDY